jgi:DNA modification methylase
VADLMCGSGTTAAVAARLGRRFVAGDRSTLAVALTEGRLRAQGAEFARLAVERFDRAGGDTRRGR